MNELLWFLLLLINFVLILFVYRFFGKTGLYVWIPISTIVANIQVIKTIEIFGVSATLGNIVYASSFLVTDILSENYGKRDARRAVAFGFLALIAAMILMNLAILFEPGPEDIAHESIAMIFGLLPRIVLASLSAYFISQLHDIWAYHYWKKILPKRTNIWIWNNASTFVSQLIDSLVFTFIAFSGVFSSSVFWEIVITTYVLKLGVAVADTPLVYMARSLKERGKVREIS